jgi:hypothetical protein
MEQTVQTEIPVRLVHKAVKAILVLLEPQVQMVQTGQMETPATPVLLVLKAELETQARPDH